MIKVPKTFISGNKKETDKNQKNSDISLEDLIPKSINHINCEEKIITGLVNNYYVYNPDFQRLSEDYPLVNRMAIAKYGDNNKKIVIMEYKKQYELVDSLQRISEYLDTYHMADRRNFLKKRLFSKNNILVWIACDDCFAESASLYYKNLGFEPFK